jgi:RecB family exonuclease
LRGGIGDPGREQVLVVVPSRRVAAQWADDARGPSVHAAGAAAWTGGLVTLRGLVERGAVAHPTSLPLLRGPAIDLLVADVVDTLEPEARDLLGPGAQGMGATRAIAAAITEVRMAGLSAVDVAEASAASHVSARRLKALASMLDAYERRLAAIGWWDPAMLHREVTALVDAGAWPSSLERFEVRELYDVTPLQGALLLAIARRSRAVRISVPFDPADEEATAFAFPYVHLWESFDDPAVDANIEFLDAGGSIDRVRFTSATDPGAESRLAAGWAEAKARAGAPLEEIGMVVAGGMHRIDALGRELSRRGLAWHARRAAPLDETPLVAALLLPFRLFEEGFARSDLLAWITSPLTARLDPDLLRPALARGPAGVVRAGEWTRHLAAARGESAALLTSVVRDLDRLARVDHEPAAFWEEFGRIVSRMGLDPGAGPIDSRDWERWEEVLFDLREALEANGQWKQGRASWRTHRRHLMAALAERSVSRGVPGRGLAILTPQDARGLRFRHSAILGLVQGALVPPRASAAVLGDAERFALNEALGTRLFRLAADDAREGSLLLRERIRATGEEIFLSHSIEDDDGDPLLPALELETLRRSARLETDAPLDAPDPAWLRGREPALVARLQRLEQTRAAFFAVDPPERRLHAGRHDGAFDARAAAELRGEIRGGVLAGWSAGRFESWRQCPHQFFQKYVLRLEPAEENPLEAEPVVVGRLVHAALERLYSDHDAGDTPPTRARIEAALAAASEEVSRFRRGDPAVWAVTVQRAAAVLERYFALVAARQPSDALRPEGREIAFGLDGPDSEPAVPLVTGLGPIALRGRIDRLDRDPASGEIRLVDYKFSRAQRQRAGVDAARCGESRFQLYVYFLAALAWAERRGHATPPALEGWVHCLLDPSILGPLPAPTRPQIEERLRAVLAEASESIFDPTPRDSDECRFCDFRRSCRIATVAGPVPAGWREDEP